MVSASGGVGSYAVQLLVGRGVTGCPGGPAAPAGGLAAAAIIAVALHAVWHQIIETLHVILLALEITGLVLVSAAAVAALYAVTYGVRYVRARILHRAAPPTPIPARVVHPGRPNGHGLENTARPLELGSPRPGWPHAGHWADIHASTSRRTP